ncbi:hypothetical protein AURDEDRAFT_150043 [Auricularia subglabra TFB-10046 SS5]|nr:hypothetical protein AURDEDRAFT_150043 [Auricularia subglabra TFB-10046 SS5]
MHAGTKALRAAHSLARVARQVPSVLAFARHRQLQSPRRDASSSSKRTALDPDMHPAMLEVYASARKARNTLPLEDALAQVQDLLKAPAVSHLRPDHHLFSLILGNNIYNLSDVERISQALGITPDYRAFTNAINNAVRMLDPDEALALYDEAWKRDAAPRNSAARSVIRGLVYPQNGGTFAGAQDILIAVDVLNQQLKRPPIPGEKEDSPLELRPLMSAIVANPDIPRRERVIDDILYIFHQRGWRLDPNSPRVSVLLDPVYRCSSHADACYVVANERSLHPDERRHLLYHIATMRFHADSVMSGTDLRLYAMIGEKRGTKVKYTHLVAYLNALRDILPSDTPNPGVLATVRDVEEWAVEKYGAKVEHRLFYRALLNVYGRLGALEDVRRAWRWIVNDADASKGPLTDGAVRDALRAFPPTAAREVWKERAARWKEPVSLKIYATWVEVLCRIGSIDEAFAVYNTKLGDDHPGSNAGGVLFAAARSDIELEAFAKTLPRTWASVRTQRMLHPRARQRAQPPS